MSPNVSISIHHHNVNNGCSHLRLLVQGIAAVQVAAHPLPHTGSVPLQLLQAAESPNVGPGRPLGQETGSWLGLRPGNYILKQSYLSMNLLAAVCFGKDNLGLVGVEAAII